MPRRRAVPSTGGGTVPKRRRSDRLSRSRTARDDALGGVENTGRHRFVSDGDFLEHNTVLNPIDITEDTALVTEEIDFNIKANRAAHFTSEYELAELIVRRGQEFTITITFARDYNPDTDDVVLQFTTGGRPQESKGTVIRVPVSKEAPKSNDDWYASYKNHLKSSLEVVVVSPPDAIVGRYHTFVETLTKGVNDKKLQARKEFDETFVVLFNAWCKEDEVYMEDEKEREEYVMNPRGRIWQGTARRNAPCAWNFGQFEDVVLEAVLYLMDKAELGDGARSNPLSVIRCMSAMTNSNDADGGVLTGRWTETYPKNTTVPWAWSGSVAILEEFMEKKKAVKYGQCWVFSGLLTTLLRSLGIPTRSVTNFESAHDTDASMTIDYHWNEDDTPNEDYNDSVWNFHVWNESWVKRPDLPEGYDGWQAVDATPQELSEGIMRCGPASVKAIKEGSVYFQHDTPFIFAEVNGDKVHWLLKNDGSMEVLMKETNVVGLNISTKAVGSNFRNDITNEYKHKEGSEEERKAVQRAFRHSSRREHQVYDVPPPDVTFKLDAPDNVTIGEDFEITTELKNTTDETRNVTVRLTAVCSYYTGVTSEQVGTNVYTETLEPQQSKTCSLPITHDAYQKFLKPDSMVTIYLKGTVKETKKAYAKIDTISMLRPSLLVKAPERVDVGEKFTVDIKFTNPLDEALTGGVLHIEAPGIMKSMVVPIKNRIGAGKEMVHTLNLEASRSGNKEIVINFSSDQLSAVTGEAEIYVKFSY